MRKRYIKPSIFSNEILGVDEADPLYTILFEGLWCIADREGRLEDRPHRIKSKIFPYRNIPNIDAMLQWLADTGFVVRYQVGGVRYIQVVQFSTHQSPHVNEVVSVIPAIPLNAADTGTATNGASTATNGASTSLLNSNSNSNLVRGGQPPPTASASGTAQTAEDPVERRIWTDGVELLVRAGMSEKAARPLLGRWAADHGRERLAMAIAAAQAANSPDPKGYIGGVLRTLKGDKAAMYVGKEGPSVEIIKADLGQYACAECFDSGRVVRAAKDGERGLDGLVLGDCACRGVAAAAGPS
jgi:hypothetical protein